MSEDKNDKTRTTKSGEDRQKKKQQKLSDALRKNLRRRKQAKSSD
jgi:hypothetical protein